MQSSCLRTLGYKADLKTKIVFIFGIPMLHVLESRDLQFDSVKQVMWSSCAKQNRWLVDCGATWNITLHQGLKKINKMN